MNFIICVDEFFFRLINKIGFEKLVRNAAIYTMIVLMKKFYLALCFFLLYNCPFLVYFQIEHVRILYQCTWRGCHATTDSCTEIERHVRQMHLG